MLEVHDIRLSLWLITSSYCKYYRGHMDFQYLSTALPLLSNVIRYYMHDNHREEMESSLPGGAVHGLVFFHEKVRGSRNESLSWRIFPLFLFANYLPADCHSLKCVHCLELVSGQSLTCLITGHCWGICCGCASQWTWADWGFPGPVLWFCFLTGWSGLEATVDVQNSASGICLPWLWQYLLKSS